MSVMDDLLSSPPSQQTRDLALVIAAIDRKPVPNEPPTQPIPLRPQDPRPTATRRRLAIVAAGGLLIGGVVVLTSSTTPNSTRPPSAAVVFDAGRDQLPVPLRDKVVELDQSGVVTDGSEALAPATIDEAPPAAIAEPIAEVATSEQSSPVIDNVQPVPSPAAAAPLSTEPSAPALQVIEIPGLAPFTLPILAPATPPGG